MLSILFSFGKGFAVFAPGLWLLCKRRIDAAVYGQLDMSICNAEPNIEPLSWYSPEDSALFRPFIAAKSLTSAERIVFGYSVVSGLVLAGPFAASLLTVSRLRAPALAREWWSTR